MKIPIQSATPFTDEFILGYDPECADMSNPDGARWGKAIFIEAVTEGGRRFILAGVQFDNHEDERAAKVADRIQKFGEINLDFWVETYEVYGSPAWQFEDDLRQRWWNSDPNTQGTVRDY